MTPDLPMPSEEQDVPDYICRWSNCGLNFENLDSLVNHLTAAHVTSQHGSYFCMWQGCSRDKGFNARYKMLIHIRTHTNERPFQCTQCGKRFSRQENLRIHARTHTGEKPYVCAILGCGKAYSNSSDRFKHSRTHMVEKPYECRFPGCTKRYTDPSSLRKHVKIYGHSKKPDDPSMSNIPPPSISPSSSGSSSLGASPVPMAPTPPSLMPASYFSPNNSSVPAAMGGIGGLDPQITAAAAWTVALQRIHSATEPFRNFQAVQFQTDGFRQYQSENFKQYPTDLFLRSGTGVSPVDMGFSSPGGMHPCSPLSNPLFEEDEEEEGLGMDIPPARGTSSAIDLSIMQSPLDLSLPSSRRRHQ